LVFDAWQSRSRETRDLEERGMEMCFRLIRSITVLSFAALLAGVFPALVDAQPKPALVQNIDEPGRNPYQQGMNFLASGTTCGSLSCIATFPAVPPGKRLVLTYVSALYGLSANAISAFIQVGKTGDTDRILFLPAVTANPAGSGASYTAAGPVTFYYEPGDTPTVTVDGQNINFGSTVYVTLVGYLVSLP
jgi:hypothetical protein